MKATNIVAYYRVSTTKQGRSGLGLEAQQAAINLYAMQRNATIVAEFCEIETGKRSDRPQLALAMAATRQQRATLVIAKLDRLARNVHFVSGLMESGVPFDCADRPGADAFRLHIEAAVGEEEARKISERTRAALAAYKARGGLLGGQRPECRNLSAEARQRGADATRAKATAAYAPLANDVQSWRAAGLSLSAVADRLNQAGHVTTAGRPFTATAVHRMIGRS
jgi:DNA invertase Pin-like site-specific DNA recombinase